MDFWGLENLTGEAAEGLRILVIVGAILLLILAISVFAAIEKARFRRWYNCNSMLDTPLRPWRPLVPWHRTGSKWYNDRAGSFATPINHENDPAAINRLYKNVGKTLRVRGYRYRSK